MTYTTISVLERHFGFLICAILSLFNRVWLWFAKAKKVEPVKKIVFVKFIEQGAFILHRATIKRAAEKYGNENVYICTFSPNASLIDILKVVPLQNVLYINDKSIYQLSISFLSALLRIRKLQIDTAIDLEFYSRATAIFCYLTGAGKRAGYHRFDGAQNYRGNLFTHRLNYSHYVHVADSGWSLLQSVESPFPETLPALNLVPEKNFTIHRFIPTASDNERVEQLLHQSFFRTSPIIVINLSLNDALPLRKWPETYYQQFIALFRKKFPEFIFVFTGRSDEEELTERFIATAGITNRVNLCGRTELRDILTLYSKAKLLLTSDSGPAHLATLTTVSTIVLFGPETPALYAPLSDRTKVFYSGLVCSPCFNVYNNRQSPCVNNVCMQTILVEQVMQATCEILQSS